MLIADFAFHCEPCGKKEELGVRSYELDGRMEKWKIGIVVCW